MDLDAIATRLRCRFGPSVSGWVRTLPQRLAMLSARWDLWIGPAFRSGTSSLVLACTGPRGEAVLKPSPDGAGLAWCRVVAPIRAAQGRRVWRGAGTELVSAGPAALRG